VRWQDGLHYKRGQPAELNRERDTSSLTPRMAERASGSVPIRTPDQRLRVFVSSTLGELAPERAAARRAINRLRLTPVMFETGARPYPPKDVYRTYLAQSDVFIGIYGERYGWVAPGEDISGLEDEYLHSRGKPALLYVKAPVAQREPRLQALLDGIRQEALVSYRHFESVQQLERFISDDLALLLTERFVGSSEPARWRRVAGQLPAQRGRVIGREAEIEEVTRLLLDREVRQVTITGLGGVGKTTVAVTAAAQVANSFRDGAMFVELAGTTDARLVLSTIASALGIPEVGEPDLGPQIAGYLAGKDMLIVLDNVEQLLDAAPLAGQAIELAPQIKILATSREALRIRGEHLVVLSPLAEESAVDLFIERTRAAAPGLKLTDSDKTAVAEMCRRLDGIPLAIELAAARTRLLAPAAILARLDTGLLPLLSHGPRDLPERQRTLSSTIDWSFALLSDDERLAFSSLAVFSGGFTIEAVEDVCHLAGDPVDVLESLVEKSLVMHDENRPDPARYELLDTIREYALGRAEDSGDLPRLRRAHAIYFRELASAARQSLRGSDQLWWMHRLQAERRNIRAALEWSVAPPAGEPAVGLKLAAELWWWFSEAALGEGSRWLERMGQVEDPELASWRALAMAGASWLAYLQTRHGEAANWAARALEIDPGSEPEVRLSAWSTLGAVALDTGQFERAGGFFEQVLTLRENESTSGIPPYACTTSAS
jgi:predicted ATPase